MLPSSVPRPRPEGRDEGRAMTEEQWRACDAAWDARMAARDFIPGTDWERERAWQAGLLRDLVGSPFREVRVEPAWLAFDGGAVTKLARVIYDEDRFGDLPILADALEE